MTKPGAETRREYAGCFCGNFRTGMAAVCTAISFAWIAGSPAFAQPVQWPANGHYYELVRAQVSWTTADAAASAATFNGLPGHLATITSQSENDFIRDNVAVDELAWIGLTDSASEGIFKWVTGEPLVYTNWAPGEPSNGGGVEDYVEFIGFFGPQQGEWNDLSNNSGGGRFYVIEYERTSAAPAPSLSPVGVFVLAGLLLVVGCWRLVRAPSRSLQL